MDGINLVSRKHRGENTVVNVNGVLIGTNKLIVMAGPCAVESREQLLDSAHIMRELGADILRGGAFKPRTSPYSFQGLAEVGLKLLAEARELTGMPIVTEVMDTQDLDLVSYYSDILQIGSRNMQNFSLLREAGKRGKPVLLKRGLAATLEEWLNAAEYIVSEGNDQVILCERGIRTFETYTRNTLDLSAVPAIKALTHLPVIVDPSHATGRWEMVNPLAKGALAVGADGLLIEVHPNPDKALCDGQQSLNPTNFHKLMQELKPLASAMGKII